MSVHVFAPILDKRGVSELAWSVVMVKLYQSGTAVRKVGRNGRHAEAEVSGRRVLVMAPSPTLCHAVDDALMLASDIKEFVIGAHGHVGSVGFGVSGSVGVRGGKARSDLDANQWIGVKQLVNANPQLVITHMACSSAQGLPGAILYRFLARISGATVRGFPANQDIKYFTSGFEGDHVVEVSSSGCLRYRSPDDPSLWFVRWLP